MAESYRFIPTYGTIDKINQTNREPGRFYVSTDTGEMFVDISNTERITIGGKGVSLFYASDENVREDEDNENLYLLSLDAIDNADDIRVDDLILNQTDGCFYKVWEIDAITGTVYALRLSVSGSGGGGGETQAKGIRFKVNTEERHSTILNNQAAYAIIDASASMDEYGEYNQDYVVVTWNMVEDGRTVPYLSGTFNVDNNVPFRFEYGTRLKENTLTKITFIASDNTSTSKPQYINVNTVELTLTKSSTFSNVTRYGPGVDFKLACDLKGQIKKLLNFYIDGELLDTKVLNVNDSGTITSKALDVEHGAHTAKIELFSYDNDTAGPGPEPLEFEFAYIDPNNMTPVIWCDNYKDTYYSYDKIQIPYLVYDPVNAPNATVNFYKGSTPLESKTTVLNWNDIEDFQIFEITDAIVDYTNLYTIVCNGASKNIIFECITDPNRDMNVISDGLILKFDAAGRSNNESSTNRQLWSYDYVPSTAGVQPRTFTGTFTGFNWYNNGWMYDENNNSCLRISNGAQFSVNLGSMILNRGTAGQQSCTFEFEFKVKNIQNYGKVIKEITRYKSSKEGVSANDNSAYEVFLAQMSTGFDNYDTFLTALYSGDNTEYVANGYTNIQAYIHPDLSYDDLEITKVEKLRDLDNAFANYFNNAGFCLGAQDGFFFDGVNSTVNVKYVEDKLVNLSIVFDYATSYIFFYLNGVLSSVQKAVGHGTDVLINANNLVFSSRSCDIDLYKFRVYNKALSVKEIDTNYAIDHRDVILYDQANWLAQPNANLGGEYQLTWQQMNYYNEQHPDEFLMPYMVIDTTNATSDNGGLGAGVLPYRKAKKTNGVHVTFYNTGLEYMYEHGKLGDLAEKAGYTDIPNGLTAVQQYYMHHCPSWTSKWYVDSTTEDITAPSAVNLAVQGTSSEFYPRRNYKIKTKGKDKNGDSFVYMFMNAGPFADMYKKDPMSAHLDWFYFDNNTVGTTKYTMKIDYMESSGTYNMGFANFVHNAYTKHPLNDYNKAGAFCKLKSTIYPVATTFKEGTKYFVETEKDGKKSYTKAEVQPTVETFGENTYYTEENIYEPYQFDHVEDYRTNVQGFPVLMFHLNGDPNNSANYTFIGRYNMLLDKGSDEAYGFKPDKKILSTFCKKKAVSKIAECWEFSDNSRTYCSFNDPLGRPALSFSQATGIDSTDKTGTQVLNSPETGGAGGAPAVADSFEYRYHKDGDLLDYLYAPDSSGVDIDELQEEDYPIADYGDLHDQTNRNKAFFDIYKNWEKACQWLYSTRTDNQPSQNAYKVIALTADTYEPNVYYVKTSEIIYEEATGEFDDSAYYYEKITDDEGAVFYEFAEDLTADQYAAGTYYLQNTTGYIKATDEEFDVKETYYQADFSYQSAQYALNPPVVYGSTTYNYDTKEYRLAKFKNEFKKHFDLEYSLVYFIMTEAFMCYDSRGKNCMMASWGPLEEGGDYIWYPVFYDMDTQLGINNTGIPSFEYYVNATEEGCYSTNDSVLWMNLYEAFFPEIKAKYYTMRGSGEGIVNINTGKRTTPLKGVDSASIENSKDDIDSTVEHIEKWYLANPDETGCLAMLGQRPLIALNLDEYYKYISIINPKIGYQNRDGGLEVDTGTYFYALQGDRSLSRQQFLSNRLNFIDSWLNNGEYARGGSAIFGRIGCNDSTGQWYSDRYVNRESEATTTDPSVPGLLYQPYYDANGNKANYLDGDVTVTLTPYQRSYVAIGGDNGITASEQYNGRALSLDLPSSVVEGRLNSGSYGEQLFYIYGTKSLQDIGDTSTLYWSEFYANKSPRLQRIMLGSNYPGYFNHHMNYPNLDASSESRYGKPLLKEVNLDGVWIQGDTRNFDLTSSEKLTHFEALDSNITDVAFAAGVALDTLYLPDTINALRLTEARRLTTLLTTKPLPATVEEFRNWNPDNHQGLYIEGLTNKINTTIPVDSATETSNINIFSIIGGSLGYNSYKMLDTLYQLKSTAASASAGNNDLSIALKDVNWCPYVKLVEGDLYDANSSNSYYEDDQHFGFKHYTYRGQAQFEQDILNGNVYRLTGAISNTISSIALLEELRTNPHFTNTNTSGDKSVPIITGIVYVNNDVNSPVDEGEIANIFQNKVGGYPASTYETAGLNIFFNSVTKGYSAKFVFIDPDTGMEQIQGTQHISVGDINTKPTFDNPYELYSIVKPHEVFNGWSTLPPSDPNCQDAIISADEWNATPIDTSVDTHVYYAIMSPETYTATFYNYDQSLVGTSSNVYSILPGSVSGPASLPVKPWTERNYETQLGDRELHGDLTKCWVFKGWTEVPLSVNGTPNFAGVSGRIVDFDKLAATDHMYFMAVYGEGSVYDTELPSKFYTVSDVTINGVQGVSLRFTGNANSWVSGKICLPTMVNGKPVLSIKNFQATGYTQNHGITHIFWKKENRAVIKIEEYCFQRNNYLEYVEMPSTLTTIGQQAFSYDDGALGLNWTDDMYREFLKYVTFFEYRCFTQCNKLTKLYLNGNITYIGDSNFRNCASLNYVAFGDVDHPFGAQLSLNNIQTNILHLDMDYIGTRPRVIEATYLAPAYAEPAFSNLLIDKFGIVLDPSDERNGWTVVSGVTA